MPSCLSDKLAIVRQCHRLAERQLSLLAGGLDDPLHQVAAKQQTGSSKSLQLSASPSYSHRHESLFTPAHQVPIAHLQQPSHAKRLIKSTGLPAMHPAQVSPVKVGSQRGMVRTPQGCLKPNSTTGLGKVSTALPASEKRSPLKGSNAWPPASPSPRKSIYGHSQNRAPVRGNGSAVAAVIQQPCADRMALHHRLR